MGEEIKSTHDGFATVGEKAARLKASVENHRRHGNVKREIEGSQDSVDREAVTGFDKDIVVCRVISTVAHVALELNGCERVAAQKNGGGELKGLKIRKDGGQCEAAARVDERKRQTKNVCHQRIQKSVRAKQ